MVYVSYIILKEILVFLTTMVQFTEVCLFIPLLGKLLYFVASEDTELGILK